MLLSQADLEVVQLNQPDVVQQVVLEVVQQVALDVVQQVAVEKRLLNVNNFLK